MQEFQHKRKLRKRLYSKTVMFILAMLLIYAIWGGIGAYSKKVESDKILQKTMLDYQAYLDRSKNIKLSVDRLNTPNGVEDEIHQKFNVVKDGEKVAVIVEDNKNVSSESVPEPKSWWGNFIGWFGSFFK